MLYKAEMWKWKAERFSGLTCKVWGSSIENYYSTRLFIAKVIPRQGRKVTCKRAKSKLVWDFAASMSNLSNGQRWEAQRAAEQCLETGGMMFERSEFLPPQALRQAASGEVCTDWKMSQSDSWICSANRQHWQHIVVRSADVVCTARGAKRQCCQLLAPNALPDCLCFWVLFSKSTERKSWRKIQVND